MKAKSYLKHNTVMAFKALKEIFRVHGFKIERVVGSGYYPFPKLLGRVLCRLDKAHAHFITLKVLKKECGEQRVSRGENLCHRFTIITLL